MVKGWSSLTRWLSVVCCWAVLSPVLAEKVTVTYCVDPDWLPYEAIENSQHIGLSSDYIKLLEENTNYDFQLVITETWQQSLNAIKSGDCMVLPMLNKTSQRDLYLDFTKAYFTAPNFLVSAQEQPFLQGIENIGQRTLGLTQGYRISEFIKRNYPNINTMTFETEYQGLRAVAEGQIDLFIGSVLSVNNHIQKHGLSNLKLAGWAGPSDILRMGVAKGQHELLNNLNQALSEISDHQHFDIYNRWNDVTIIDNTNYKLIWQVVLGGLIVLALILLRYSIIRDYNQKLTFKNQQLSQLQQELMNSNAELQRISQHDDLTGLYNRHHFNGLIASGQYNNFDKGPLCLIVLDLDLFKAINDNHGHVVGDQVLKAFGGLLLECCDAADVVGRWGGEEFIIIKQPAEQDEAKKLCEKIQVSLSKRVFPHQQRLTCSFGIACMKPNEGLMDCFKRADQMLYAAKNQGRNQICQ